MDNKQVICDRRNATLMNNDKWLQFYARWFESIVYMAALRFLIIWVFVERSYCSPKATTLYICVWTVQSAITLTYLGYDLWATFLFYFRHEFIRNKVNAKYGNWSEKCIQTLHFSGFRRSEKLWDVLQSCDLNSWRETNTKDVLLRHSLHLTRMNL